MEEEKENIWSVDDEEDEEEEEEIKTLKHKPHKSTTQVYMRKVEELPTSYDLLRQKLRESKEIKHLQLSKDGFDLSQMYEIIPE